MRLKWVYDFNYHWWRAQYGNVISYLYPYEGGYQVIALVLWRGVSQDKSFNSIGTLKNAKTLARRMINRLVEMNG